MSSFQINNDYEIVCETKKTRHGFKHEATLLNHGQQLEAVKICYLNRTWESFEYQSVMQKLLDKSIKTGSLSTPDVISRFKTLLVPPENTFKMVTMAALMGDVLCDTTEEKNKWKVKMLKAGLGDELNLPDDWSNLPEEEKARRLEGAIKELK